MPSLLRTKPAKFWQYINPKSEFKTPTLKDENGDALSNETTSELFNKHFAQVFTKEAPLRELPDDADPVILHPCQSIIISEAGVVCAIERLPQNSSPGPDGISNKLLKLTCHTSATLLALVFQKSLESACLPDDWKIAHVIPTFKSGVSTCPNNYRPISLTSVCCKLLEHIIYTHVMSHLNDNNLLLEQQHGFRYKKSCQTQLFELVSDLHDSLHALHYVDAIFVDL